MTINQYLRNNRLFTDGAMGTYYAEKMNQQDMIPEYANIKESDVIKEIHLEYLRAGANLLRTNTFAANKESLSAIQVDIKECVTKAVAIAREAISAYRMESGSSLPIYIAGDIGPIPNGFEKSDNDLYQDYCEQADLLLKQGVDAILFETFHDVYIIRRVADYIQSKQPEMFIMAEMNIGSNGYSAGGMSAGRILSYLSESESIDACGFNCGTGSGHMLNILKNLVLPSGKYLMISPNAGYPEQMQSRMNYIDNKTYFAKNMKEIAELGIEIIGACCGTTPEFIRAVKEIVPDRLTTKRKMTQAGTINQDKIQKSKNEFLRVFDEGRKVIAVELDPPYDAKDASILKSAKELKECGVDMITIADSPMGKSRIDSIMMAQKIYRTTGMRVMPHICCRDKNMIAMRGALLGAYINDIRNLLIVTGDPVPEGMKGNVSSVFDYNSIKLMGFVKEMNQEHFADDPFIYGGALNHALKNADKIAERMCSKMKEGAEYFLTQPIYSAEDADRIRYLKDKTGARILCGIMPLVSYRNAYFIQNEMTGINLPDHILNRYHENMTREEGEQTGADIAIEIMDMLSDCADGYYFMLPFNRVSLMKKIFIS